VTISNISGNALADAILTAMHPTSATTTLGSITLTNPTRLALIATVGSVTAAGTQISGGSYTAVGSGTGGISIATNWAAASGASQATNAIISQANMPGTTTNGVEIWDSTNPNKRIELGNITAKTTVAGDTLSFASAAITSALA
jgi:hypothetical protein